MFGPLAARATRPLRAARAAVAARRATRSPSASIRPTATTSGTITGRCTRSSSWVTSRRARSRASSTCTRAGTSPIGRVRQVAPRSREGADITPLAWCRRPVAVRSVDLTRPLVALDDVARLRARAGVLPLGGGARSRARTSTTTVTRSAPPGSSTSPCRPARCRSCSACSPTEIALRPDGRRAPARTTSRCRSWWRRSTGPSSSRLPRGAPGPGDAPAAGDRGRRQPPGLGADAAPVVKEFPGVVLVAEPRQGLAYARNAGFLAARAADRRVHRRRRGRPVPAGSTRSSRRSPIRP